MHFFKSHLPNVGLIHIPHFILHYYNLSLGSPFPSFLAFHFSFLLSPSYNTICFNVFNM